MERLPLQGEDLGGAYGTGEATRVHAKRKGSPSAKCLVVSSAIIVAVLVGALHFVREAPSTSASSEPARVKHDAHKAVSGSHSVAQRVSVRGQHKRTVIPGDKVVSSLRSREGPGHVDFATSLSAQELQQLPEHHQHLRHCNLQKLQYRLHYQQ